MKKGPLSFAIAAALLFMGGARSLYAADDKIGRSKSGANVFSVDQAGAMTIPALTSCDTIDTDANGKLSCGTDAGAGSANLSSTQTFTGANTFVSSVTITNTAPVAPAINTIYSDNIVKGWCIFDGALADPITCEDEFNVTTVTDNSTGNYTVNWDRDFANTDYIVLCNASVGLNVTGCDITTRLVGSVNIRTSNTSASLTNGNPISIIALGDQ